jgi:hypothetical protein
MKLKDWIEENGLKTAFVAKKLEMPLGNLYNILNGQAMPSLSLAVAIQEYTNGKVTCKDLLTRRRHRERASQELKDQYEASKKVVAPIQSLKTQKDILS